MISAIGDGFDFEQHIGDTPSVPRCCVRFRPCLAEEAISFHRRRSALRPGDGARELRLVRELLDRHIIAVEPEEDGEPLATLDGLAHPVVRELLGAVLSYSWAEERADRDNIARSAAVLVSDPHIFHRSCRDCATYVYAPDGSQTMRFGLPVLRPAGTSTPCGVCPKTSGRLPRTWREAAEPSERTLRVIDHWRRCRAVGRFPSDVIVERNAAILHEIHEQAEANERTRLMSMLMLLKGVREKH